MLVLSLQCHLLQWNLLSLVKDVLVEALPLLLGPNGSWVHLFLQLILLIPLLIPFIRFILTAKVHQWVRKGETMHAVTLIYILSHLIRMQDRKIGVLLCIETSMAHLRVEFGIIVP